MEQMIRAHEWGENELSRVVKQDGSCEGWKG